MTYREQAFRIVEDKRVDMGFTTQLTPTAIYKAIAVHQCEQKLALLDALKERISVEVYQQDWIPGFAAFKHDGSLEEAGKAHVILNIGGFLGAVAAGDLPISELPYHIAESLMHEVVHVFEAWAKVEFNEERVEALIAKYAAIADAEKEEGNA